VISKITLSDEKEKNVAIYKHLLDKSRIISVLFTKINICLQIDAVLQHNLL
jgi:hypothetical protein